MSSFAESEGFDRTVEQGSAEDHFQSTGSKVGRIHRVIFDGFDTDGSKHIATRSLKLENVTLLQPAVWFRTIKLDTLQSIIISDCNGAADAVKEMGHRGGSFAQLTCLSIIHCEKEKGPLHHELQEMLSKIPLLEHLNLSVCCTTDEVFSESVLRHAPTLRQLEMRPNNANKDCVCKLSNLRKLAQSCKKLEELTVPLPECDILDSLDEGNLNESLTALGGPDSQLCELRVLQLLNWPTNVQHSSEEPMSRGAYDHRLQKIALRLFKAREQSAKILPKIHTITFGAEGTERSANPDATSIFVRATQCVPWTTPETTAMQVTHDWLCDNANGATSLVGKSVIVVRKPPNVKMRDPRLDAMPMDTKKWTWASSDGL